MPGLGRIESPDPRDTAFAMRLVHRLMGVDDRPLIDRLHRPGPILNQRETGTCVAHSWEAVHQGPPRARRPVPGFGPFDQYRRIVAMDEFPGNDGEAAAPDAALQYGTSVRAGARLYAEVGRIETAYVWAQNADEGARHVCRVAAPVVLGIAWLDTFFDPDTEGLIRVTPRSRVVGGHAIKWLGVDARRGLAVLQNSWGREWGGWTVNGRRAHAGLCRIPLDDLDRLIRDGGEACAAVEGRFLRKKS
jgi:hypothetical protein